MPKLESDTNQLYRKKYFIDSANIVSGIKASVGLRPLEPSQVIDSNRITFSKRPVPLRASSSSSGDLEKIRVDVVREGNKVKGLRIACPCGRHTELDVEYGPVATAPATPH